MAANAVAPSHFAFPFLSLRTRASAFVWQSVSFALCPVSVYRRRLFANHWLSQWFAIYKKALPAGALFLIFA